MKLKNKFLVFGGACALALGLASCDKNDDESKSTASASTSSVNEEEIKEEFLADANEVKIEENSVTFTDASGEGKKTISKNPKKVYNLYASFTTLWYEAGGVCSGVIGGDSSINLYNTYIGRDITQDEGVEVLATSSSGKKWSTETIIAGQPDLIVCSTAMSGYATISGPAEAANIPTIAVSYDSFTDYLKWFRVFSAITDNEKLWEDVALTALDDVVDVICETKEVENNTTVCSLFSGNGSWKINTKYTVVGEMINELGVNNIADSWDNSSEVQRIDIDLEKILASNPKMILIQCHSGVDEVKANLEELYGDNALWKQIVKNVGEDNVIFLEPQYFHYKPNSKFSYAYQTLAKILYSDYNFSFEK